MTNKNMTSKNLKSFALVLLCTMLNIGSVWGQITVDSNPKTSGTYTITCEKADGANAPIDCGDYIRCYANNTITIATTGANMTQIVITWTKNGSKTFASVTASPGTYTHAASSGQTGTWTGNTNSVTFTVGATGQIQITTVSITAGAGATFTLNYHDGTGNHTRTSISEGSNLITSLGSPSASCDGTSTTFVGWSTTEITSKTNTPPTFVSADAVVNSTTAAATYYAVYAKGTTTYTPVANTWTRITSTSQLTDGATVMLVQYYSDYAINTTPGATYCVANAEISNSNTALRWTAVQTGSKWKFKNSGNHYLSTSALTDGTGIGLDQTYDEWTITADAGGGTGSQNTYTNTNCFNLNNGNHLEYYSSAFKVYTWSIKYSSAYPFYIYIQKTNESTTYSEYITTCCTPLAAVNGSFALVSGSYRRATLKAAASGGTVAGATGYEVKVPGSSSHNNWTAITTSQWSTGVTVTGLSCGTTYTAYFRATDNTGTYCDKGTENSTTLEVGNWTPPTLTYTTPLTAGGSTVSPTWSTSPTHTGTLTYSSSNTSAVEVINSSTGVISPVGAGTATITASWTQSDDYCAITKTSNTITVNGDFTVTFNKNGGGGTMANQSIPYNTPTALTSNAFTAPNSCKEFYGWATSQANADAGTRAYTDGQSVTLTSAGLSLYAIWRTKTYTVTKGSCSTGSFNLSNTSVDCDGTITVSGTPDASHKGDPIVSISPADGGTVSGTSITNIVKNITVNVSFAAKEVYTITWNDKGSTTTSSVTEGNAITTLPSNPSSCSATYSHFVGWFPNAAGTESSPTLAASVASLGTQITAETVPEGSTTYYAVFADGDPSACAYTKIQTLGGMSIGDKVVLVGSTTKELSGPATNSANSASISESCPTGVYELEVCAGYTSGKYAFKNGTNYLAHDGTNKKLNTQTYVDAASSWTVSFAGSEVYYQVTLTNCSSGKIISFNNGDRFLCYDSEQTTYKRYLYKYVGTASGYISSCCAVPAVTSVSATGTGATTATISWTNPSNVSAIDHFKVIMTEDNGTPTSTVKVDNITKGAANASKSANITGLTECHTYKFKVVSVGTCDTYSDETSVQPYASAKTVTFDYHGGTGEPASFTTNCTTSTTTLPTPTKSGWDFKGWYTLASGGSKVGNGGASYTVSTTTTIHAQWSQNTVNFSLNGKSGTAPDPVSGKASSNIALPAPPVVSGFHFDGWYTLAGGGTRVGGTGDSYTLSSTIGAADVTLYAHWSAASISVTSPQNFDAVTNVDFEGGFDFTANTDGTPLTITKTSGDAAITATLSGTHVNVYMTAKATESTFTAVFQISGGGASAQNVTVNITTQSLAVQSITKSAYFSGDILCKNSDLSSSSTYAFSLTNPIYSAAGVVGVIGTINATNIYVYDVATGTKINGSSLNRAINGSGIVSFTLHNQVGDMVEGKKYRIEWTNTDGTCKNSLGVPYQDVSYTFTYGDCSKPIAQVACPITKNGFTANWIPSGSNSQTFNAYYYELGTTICDETYTSSSAPAVYYSQASNYSSTDNTFLSLLYGASWSSPTSSMLSWQNDTYGGWRICNTSKRWALFSKTCSTAGTYTVTFKGRAVSYANNVTIYKTDQYGEPSGSALGVYELAASGVTTVTLQVSLSSGQRIAVVPDLFVSGSKGVVAVIGLSVKQVGAKHYVGSTPASGISSAVSSREVTGLSAGTTYYYTVSNGSESNEIEVTTRSDDPNIDYSPGKAVLQTDQGGTTSTRVIVSGTNLTLCELEAAISGTNASYFGYDLSELVYNQTTGAISGTLIITYHPSGTGNHTATFTMNGQTLDLEGHACPSGFGTMALSATSISKDGATARWSQSTTGYLMLAENSRMNTNLLVNGSFELDGTGWDGIPSAMMPGNGSRQTAICTSGSHTGSQCVIMTGYGQGSYLYPYGVYSGSSVMGAAIYTEKQTLPAGTYRISCWLHNASTSSALSAANYSSDCSVYMGIAVDCPSSSYSSARRSLNDPTGSNINGKGASWFQITEDFTLEEPATGYLYICYKTSGPSYFAIDDVELKYIEVVPGNAFTENPISSATSLALTGLKPNTSYSYYVVNEDGCESNIINFNTNTSDDPISISATPNPLNATASIGTTNNQVLTISQENAYSTILLTVGDCDGRIRVSPASVSASGGSVVVSFTPKNTDEMGDKGTCTITASTLGAADETITVNWTVASGFAETTPTIEVVDITNNSMTIEHNIEEIGEGSEVHIILNRELSPEEIEENQGDEIFFSKYYEAYMHKKILAIYNPTNDVISLANTYIWRSAGSSAGDKASWNQETGISLASYGKTPGQIGPKEEIVLYNSQLSYTCEQTKTDMGDWGGTSDGAIYFDGDDAFLLVRKNVEGTEDDPPTESVGWIDPNNKGLGHPELSWREYDDGDNSWWMLDLIGARTKANTPDGSAVVNRWSWKNCTTGDTENGDERGWVGYGFGVNDDPWSTNTCAGQATAGYLLSTNRCLLIRRGTVKSGNNAVAVNVGDMYTLGKGAIQSEWKGAHVPTIPSDKQDEISCENFSFVGGYDYTGYYNSFTPIPTEEYAVGERNPVDGSYLVEPFNSPQYWCNTLRIEVVENSTVNGVEVSNVRHFQNYKVPIVVDENANTATAKFFGNPNYPTYSGAEENNKKASWATECPTCDVVVTNNATLTRDATAGSKTAFRNIQVYAGSKLKVTAGQPFNLNGVQMRADNNDVSYAILDDDGSTITVDSVVHVKRVDDANWYPFSLPYDCDVATIRQLNGKTMGAFDTYDYTTGEGVYGTWTIKEYDGEERQSANNFAGVGVKSDHWHPVSPTGTLEKNKGYIIGLYETEWPGQHKSVFFPPKNPIGTYGYTESGASTRTANVYSWAAGASTAETMNKGWNFVGLPYISLYTGTDDYHGINNTDVMIKGKYEDEYADQEHVYVAVPSDNTMKVFTQTQAGSTGLEPFKGYFVQVNGDINETKIITYYKGDRSLPSMPRRIKAGQPANQRIGFELLFGTNINDQDNTGVLLSDDYSLDYEIGRDMYKMTTSGDGKPHLWSMEPGGVKMAYNALPMANGEYIPIGMYVPSAGAYTLTRDPYSDVSNVESIELLKDGEPVADLLFDTFTIDVEDGGYIDNYALRITPRKYIPESLETVTVENIPEGSTLLIYDVVGRLVSTQQAQGDVHLDLPATGVYNIVVRNAGEQVVLKTVIR